MKMSLLHKMQYMYYVIKVFKLYEGLPTEEIKNHPIAYK